MDEIIICFNPYVKAGQMERFSAFQRSQEQDWESGDDDDANTTPIDRFICSAPTLQQLVKRIDIELGVR